MTQEQEQTPPPGGGPFLDRLVAEKLGYVWTTKIGGFGFEISRWADPKTGDDAYPGCEWDQPHYSTDIGAAWELVRRYVEQHSNGEDWPNVSLSFGPNGTVHCTLAVNMSDHEQYAIGTTEAHAIVLAFLALPDFEVKQ